MSSRSRYVGIDPGKSGGITIIRGNYIKTRKCPQTVEDMATLLMIMLADTGDGEVHIAMEQVWSFPSDSSKTAFIFGVNYGQWQGIITTLDYTPVIVSPQKWIKYYETPKMIKRDRKNWLKNKAKEYYPKLKGITLSTSDSILIARYLQKTLGKG